MNVIEGHLNGDGIRVGIVAGRFNDTITRRLLEGALDGLVRHGVAADDVTVVWVPGAFEVPLAVQRLAGDVAVDAVIALGAVIRGSTDHYDHVAGQAAAGLMSVQLSTGTPVVFEVLTTENIEQAIERSGTKAGNKGFEAAATAIEMVDVLRRLDARES